MKNVQFTLAKAVALIAIFSTSGLAFAAAPVTTGTQSLTVTGTVASVCRFYGGTTITFDIDPSAPTSQSGTTNLVYKCTNGGPAPTFSTDTGLLTGRTLTKSAGVTMAYALSLGTITAPTGFSGVGQSVALTATVLQAAYQDAVAGAYAETLSMVITP